MSDEWIRVPASGSLDAKLVLIGEAPGENEVRHTPPLPFVGPAGKRLASWMQAVGLRRADAYILNVVEYQVPNNQLDAVPKDELDPWIAYLHERLAALTDPWVIVPMGNYPLYALTGLGAVSWHMRDGIEARPGITKWRGSILSYTDQRNRTIKVIPTCHPSATFRQPSLEGVCRRDWKRIAEDLQFRELRLPIREHVIAPSLRDLREFRDTAPLQTGHKLVAIDIENPRRRITTTQQDPQTGKEKKVKGWSDPDIVCIGLSMDPSRSLTVPTTKSYWGSDERLATAWATIKEICEDPRTEKVLHNSFYDRWHLAERGIALANLEWDTMFMSHALNPSEEHALAFRASVDLRQPYWKSMAKDAGLYEEFGSSFRSFLIYNGIDVCVTRELAERYIEKMAGERRDNGMTTLEWYRQMYVPLLHALHELSRTGMRVDDQMRRRRLVTLQARCIEIQQQLKRLTGLELYGKTGLSGAKIRQFLYEVVGLPVQYAKRDKQGTKTASSNEIALRKLLQWIDKQGARQAALQEKVEQYHLKDVMTLVLEHQRTAQLSTFYRTERIDPDGRLRSEYSPNTEAGRLSSKKNPGGSGSNAQNIDRECRDMFLPEPGKIVLNVDLSAAESRLDYLLIYYLTGNTEALYKARVRPDEYDQHTAAAADIFQVPPEQVTKTQRYFGKKTAHGIFRDVRGQKLADEILKDGYTVTKEEAQGWIDTLRQKIGGIEELFRFFRREVLTKHYLENTWGRRLYFEEVEWGSPLHDELWRAAYSFWPQSECADLMNQWGFLPLWRELRGRPDIGVINAHVHDSLFISVAPESAYDVAKFLVDSLERPRVLYGVELSMPCTVEIGINWKGAVEWKRLPERAVFDRAIATLLNPTT